MRIKKDVESELSDIGFTWHANPCPNEQELIREQNRESRSYMWPRREIPCDTSLNCPEGFICAGRRCIPYENY